ncbi:hypothetical protein BDZ45DRAFT_768965 [Acephala macrosclerotiorum]|nr:hypothetical protein BDZ45DRAFT_768965 [Acephala macrosclerotiorum]
MPGFFSALKDIAIQSIRAGQASGLVNQGTKCLDKYLVTSDLEDLDEAIRVMKEAAEMLPEDVVSAINKDMQLYLWIRLGYALDARYDRMGDAGDLDLAIRLMEKAYAKTSYDSPRRGDIVVNYSTVLLNKYQKQHDSNALDKGIKLATEASNVTGWAPFMHIGC